MLMDNRDEVALRIARETRQLERELNALRDELAKVQPVAEVVTQGER
jgi:hypothetical protein